MIREFRKLLRRLHPVPIEQIAKEHNVSIWYKEYIHKMVMSGVLAPHNITNTSYAFQSRRIILLGEYTVKEHKIASFFHELAHILEDTASFKNVCEQEAAAWKVGFDIAAEYGYTFSKDTKSWCAWCLSTYNGDGNLPPSYG